MAREFLYIKNANQILITQELGKSSISSLINSILVIDNNIKIFTIRDLNHIEEKVLYDVVVKHNPPSQEEQLAKQKMISAIQFGQSIILEVATENVMLRLTTEQVMGMLIKFANIKGMLESGSLYTALGAIQAIKPDAVMTQQRIDKCANKIKAYLGI